MISSLYEKLTHKCELTDGIKLEGIVKDIKLDAKLYAGVEVSFNGNSVYTWKFYVASIKEPLIIGLDFLCHFGATLDFRKGNFRIQDRKENLKEFVTVERDEFTSCKVVLDKKRCPHHFVQVPALRNKDLYPVRAIQQLLASHHLTPSDPLFAHKNCS